MNNINDINININKFVRKLYLFKLLKGLIFSVSILSLIFLLIVAINYFYYLPVSIKKVLFFSYVVVLLFILADLIIIPFLKVIKLLPTISNYKAATYISEKIPQIQDILINILELNEQISDKQNISLINAAINQKISNIKLFNFSNALSSKDLNKYYKYLFIPLLILLFFVIFNNNILKLGTERFVNYGVLYEQQAPFNFNLLNKNLEVQNGADFNVLVQITGEYVPSIVYIVYGSNKIPMIIGSKKSIFEYNFKSINNNFSFYFEADNFKSSKYQISILPTPQISDFSVDILPPSYTGKSKYSLKNTGDLIVPYGSVLKFNFSGNNIDTLLMLVDSNKIYSKNEKQTFSITYQALISASYSIIVKNKYVQNSLFEYNLSVIPDLYPNIAVQQVQDSNNYSLFFFRGLISDDYGFKSLSFNYSVNDKNSEQADNYESVNIDISKFQSNQEFFYIFDFSDLKISNNQIVKYFFKITDNDYVSGYKSTATSQFNFYIPSLNELDSAFNVSDEKVQEQLNNAYQLSFDIQQDIDNFNQKLLNEEVSKWEKQSFLDNILNKQNELEQLLDSLKKENQEKLNNLKSFDPKNEDLLKKHEEIQKLLDELMTDEIKDLLEQLKELQSKFDDKKFDNTLKKTELSYEDMSKEMERTQELLKRMKLEQDVQNVANQLNELAKEQENLSESFKKSDKNNQELQDSLLTNQKKFEDLMQEYDSLQNYNQSLEKPYILEEFQEEIEQINQEFEQAKENMFENKNKKASQNMKNSSEQMKNLSEQMSNMMMQNSMMQNSEDEQAIKFLLSNLLNFSFTQEQLNLLTQKNLSYKSEAYIELKINQIALQNQYAVINDTLYALAKRNPTISKPITDELVNIRNNLDKTIQNLNVNKRNEAAINQRYTIESVNKLALMLQESLQNMQNQMSMPGSGNPSSSKPQQMSVGDMKQMQQSMQQQLQEMINQMKNGQYTSEQMGQQVAKREAFQKMLEDMLNSGQLSDEMSKLLNEINQINDDIKKDILNNNITPEILQRDNEIKTRLLEVENSDNKRKYDDKRESKVGNNLNTNSPEDIEKYFNDYKLLNESFSKKILQLNPFYKTYYNDYMYRLGKE